jgi:hypothetical protein
MKSRAKTDYFPTISVSPEEKRNGSLSSQSLKNGFELYQKNGCLRIKNVFSIEYLKALYNLHYQTYNSYFEDRDYAGTLTVGDKRKMITIEIKEQFNSPILYANPFIFPLLEILLSKKIILGFLGSVTSLPGAPDQHTHRDNPHIFDEPEVYEGGEQVLPLLPPYGISVAVPLVPLNEKSGTTRMFLGSHIVTLKQIRRACEYSDPTAELGDCLLMDWRLAHGGTANRSENIRPVLYLEYFRHWYRDVVNSKRRIIVSPEEYTKIPEEKLYLFDWSSKSLVNNN